MSRVPISAADGRRLWCVQVHGFLLQLGQLSNQSKNLLLNVFVIRVLLCVLEVFINHIVMLPLVPSLVVDSDQVNAWWLFLL